LFEDQLRAWDGEEVVLRFDAPSAAWMFIGVHSTVLGPAAGGTRIKSYGSPDLALADALRLSTAMTSKNAMAGLPLGGGKGVLAVPEIPSGDARRELLLRYADLLESLHGTYRTACDMNTRSEDMDVIAERCSSVFGRTEAAGGSGPRHRLPVRPGPHEQRKRSPARKVPSAIPVPGTQLERLFERFGVVICKSRQDAHRFSPCSFLRSSAASTFSGVIGRV